MQYSGNADLRVCYTGYILYSVLTLDYGMENIESDD
jgi:hypothetical protein